MTALLKDSHPEVWKEALRYPFGFNVIELPGEARPTLLLKLSQTFLLTARMNQGFNVYVVPVNTPQGMSAGLMGAFRDDEDEPLTVWSPLALDPFLDQLLQAIMSPLLNVRLFDEHNRELLGYEAQTEIPLVARVRLNLAKLFPLTHDLAHRMHEQGVEWFGLRQPIDDSEAISIRFTSPLYELDRRYIDDRPDMFSFHGAKGLAEVRLEKEEPGQFQEIDIILLLQRVFKPEQIYHAPLRVYDKEEITDILVITDKNCLIIQAKDSPNTEKQLNKKLERKRTTTLKHLRKACAQLSGAIGYLDRVQPLSFFVDNKQYVIDLGKRNILSLAVVRELFLDTYGDYSALLYELFDDIELPCIALDYSELVQYTLFCDSEEAFIGAYFEVFNKALERKGFPRLRFGVNNLFDQDGSFRFD